MSTVFCLPGMSKFFDSNIIERKGNTKYLIIYFHFLIFFQFGDGWSLLCHFCIWNTMHWKYRKSKRSHTTAYLSWPWVQCVIDLSANGLFSFWLFTSTPASILTWSMIIKSFPFLAYASPFLLLAFSNTEETWFQW